VKDKRNTIGRLLNWSFERLLLNCNKTISIITDVAKHHYFKNLQKIGRDLYLRRAWLTNFGGRQIQTTTIYTSHAGSSTIAAPTPFALEL
jgi:hypothetical protein